MIAIQVKTRFKIVRKQRVTTKKHRFNLWYVEPSHRIFSRKLFQGDWVIEFELQLKKLLRWEHQNAKKFQEGLADV